MRDVYLEFTEDNAGLFHMIIEGCESSSAILSGRHETYLKERALKTLADQGEPLKRGDGRTVSILKVEGGPKKVRLDEEEFRLVNRLLDEAQWVATFSGLASQLYRLMDGVATQLGGKE